ncbi:strawberry notch C-terminal domain-containing protein [Sulfitobacter sp. R18_1]|uniref:strawberry notch C-terminal domain-containing protein n=1 Tax=Sulfitobacter sp. R18_1 TaxID=2821104 RepID=UPI001ADC6570|nr:strawberry notch C-terminal domain-containing protein [Sulfitobacter sp. R18_1]MBO9428530.1 strawberry notch C-terminal domain-containing protein [Sulfitobacter sp. R18_1]
MTEFIDWPNLKSYGAEMHLASFSDDDRRLIVISMTGDDPIDRELVSRLGSEGFIRLGRVFIRPNGEISSTELSKAFPGFEVSSTAIADTRLRVTDPLPGIIKSALPKEVRISGANGFKLLNDFQAVYIPASKAGTPSAAIPINLAEGTYQALRDISERRGDIEQWVCDELQYGSPKKMAEYLAPEQVDAVALHMDTALDNLGTICGDQTGMGKGRVGAALFRWCALRGIPYVFLTEKSNLFTDFIRDIIDIDSFDLIGTPYILNNNVSIRDPKTTEVIFKSLKAADNKKVIQSGSLPEGTTLALGTYSQLNRKGSAKSKFFSEICRGNHLHADEIQNASGEDSNTGIAVAEAMAHANSYSYSSATHAKRGANLSIYRPILPASLADMENMVEVLTEGGMPLLEALSQMLARTGRLIRREHDLSNMNIEVVPDEKRKAEHEALLDRLAPILSQIARLSMDIDSMIEEKNTDPIAQNKKEFWYTVHWASRFSRIQQYFESALKIDICADQCIEALLNDKKPVVAVQRTMETILREIQEETEEGYIPEFKDILKSLVTKSMTARKRVGKEDAEVVDIEDPELQARADEILDLIEGFPFLAISPMDEIKRRVEKKGAELFAEGKISKPWNMGEISGRSLRVTENGIEKMPDTDRNLSIHAFQNGGMDGIFLTNAGSTGITLNNTAKIDDQRTRVMIELEVAPDASTRNQFFGRINRRGNLTPAEYICICTALETEIRSLAIQNRKMAMLSANVTGSANTATRMDVPDPINSLGNKIAKKVLQENGRLAFKMGISLSLDDETAEEELYFVNRLLSRLILLQTAEREAIYQDFMETYEDAVADLASKGIHPTKPRELPGEWTIVSREIFHPGNPDDGPVFGAPVFVTEIAREEFVYPMRYKEVQERLSAIPEGHEQVVANTLQYLTDNHNKLLRNALPKKYSSVIDALYSKEVNMVKITDQRVKRLKNMLEKFAPGSLITLSDDGGNPTHGIVTSLRIPNDVADYHKAGQFFVEFVVPGDESPRRSSLSKLFDDSNYQIRGPEEVDDRLIKEFSEKPGGRVMKTRMILDGNPLLAVKSAIENKLGTTTRLSLDNGEMISAVLVPEGKQDFIMHMPGSTLLPDVAFEILAEGGIIRTDPWRTYDGLSMVQDGPMLKVSVPKKKSLSKKFLIPEILEITGEFSGGRDHSALVDPGKLDDLCEVLKNKGFALNFDSQWRTLARKVTEEITNENSLDNQSVLAKPCLSM